MISVSSIIIIHEPTREYVYPLERNKLAIRLKIQKYYAVACKLYYWNRCKKEQTGIISFSMICYARDNMYDYYETIIETETATRYINYYFSVECKNSMIWLNYNGVCNLEPDNGFFEYLYSNENDIFKIPGWVKGSIFYQIFPDRFYNGDKSNDPEKCDKWGDEPTRLNFMGGDLKGIKKKLEYLGELGINALYLNPIFKSPSNHKYDTIDYFTIDPHFGTLEDLKNLVKKCHYSGMKIILDGVFNHCGYYFPQFQDVLKNGEFSKYKDWFYIDSFPVDEKKLNYETIGYFGLMPKLRLGNPEVRSYFLDVASYWIKEAGIDGWRLDVADEADYTFWYEFRKRVKTLNSDSFILAETWRENRDMLRGDQMDSVMNYPIKDAIVDYFARGCINSMEFDSRINKNIGVHAKPAQDALFNLLDCHDTARFLTLCGGNTGKMCAAIAFQFCYMGIPVIYYGDEIGMEGETDPGCRKTMEWSKESQNIQISDWYKKLINIRKSKATFSSGGFKSNYCSLNNSTYGFIREYGDERVYVIINSDCISVNVRLPIIESSENITHVTDMISGGIYKIGPMDNDNYYNNDINNYKSTVYLELKPYQVLILCRTK